MRRHYHVYTTVPGCLDSDGPDGPYTNRREAEQGAAALVRIWRDNGHKVTGNQLSGYTTYTVLGYPSHRIYVEECAESHYLED